MKWQMDSMKEYLINNLGYHGGTSNIGQGMPALMAPSMEPHMAPQKITPMDPTSPPIYWPIPRPSYHNSSYVDP